MTTGSHEGGKKIGRPSKFTEEMREQILKLIGNGNFREVAANYAGVSASSLRGWMAKDADFLAAVIKAEQKAEIQMVTILMIAAKKDAKHAAWWLERKCHERWGRKDRMALSASDDGDARLLPIGAVLLVSAASQAQLVNPLQVGAAISQPDFDGEIIEQ